MREFERVDAEDAVREASECCERIASVIDETTHEAELLGDPELLKRLAAARAAAGRARELIGKLAGLIEAGQSNRRQASN
jgi:hypothetical protein